MTWAIGYDAYLDSQFDKWSREQEDWESERENIIFNHDYSDILPVVFDDNERAFIEDILDYYWEKFLAKGWSEKQITELEKLSLYQVENIVGSEIDSNYEEALYDNYADAIAEKLMD